MSIRRENDGVAESIKETAGAGFHGVHKALEATENAAMNAVDATADAVRNLTDDNNEEDTLD
jgi:hypothetical protein